METPTTLEKNTERWKNKKRKKKKLTVTPKFPQVIAFHPLTSTVPSHPSASAVISMWPRSATHSAIR